MNARLKNDESHAWLGESGVAALVRQIDWSCSPIGPIERWPASLRTALDICLHGSSPMAVYWGKDLVTIYNDACANNIGDRHPASLGLPASVLYADIWESVGPILEGAFSKGISMGSRNQPIPIRQDGRLKETRYDFTANPIRDENGNVAGLLCIAFDITDHLRTTAALNAEMEQLQRLQAQQRVLVSELHHRTRNLLAVVRAIASQSFDGQLSEPALEAFLERLSALGRAQSLIGRSEYERVSLGDIVWAELEAYAPGTRQRLEVHGPTVRLSNYQVQTVALALHELVTNAVKYGALQAPEGRLSITWETWLGTNGQQRLALLWKESGVVLPPLGLIPRGQGRELIENSLRFSLRADTQLVFSNDGVWCRIELPLTPPSRQEMGSTDLHPGL
jgi:two-component sensor histidine kinase